MQSVQVFHQDLILKSYVPICAEVILAAKKQDFLFTIYHRYCFDDVVFLGWGF